LIKYSGWLLAWLFTGFISTPTFAQLKLQSTIINYSFQESKTHGRVNAYYQGKDGLIYLGHDKGVTVFDGTNWDRIDGAIYKIESIDGDSVGKIYTGGKSGAGMISPTPNGKLFHQPYGRTQNNEQGISTRIMETMVFKDQVVLINNQQLVSIVNNEQKVYKPTSMFWKAGKVNDKIYLLDWGKGLMQYTGFSLKYVPYSDFFSHKTVLFFMPFDKDKILVGTQNDGIYLFNISNQQGTLIESFAPGFKEFIKESGLIGAIKLRNGAIALNTQNNGVLIFNHSGKLVAHFNKDDGLSDDFIYELFEDNQGFIWCSSNKGVSIINPFASSYFIEDNNLSAEGVNNIVGLKGNVFFSTTRNVYKTSLAMDVLGTNPLLINKRKIRPLEEIQGRCKSLLSIDSEVIIATDNIYAISSENTKVIYPFSNVLNMIEIEHENGSPKFILAGKDRLVVLNKTEGVWKTLIQIKDLPYEISNIQKFNLPENKSTQFWIEIKGKSSLALITFNHDYSDYTIRSFGGQNGLPLHQIQLLKSFNGNFVHTGKEVLKFNENKNSFTVDTVITNLAPDLTSITTIFPSKNHFFCSTDSRYLFKCLLTKSNVILDTIILPRLDLGIVTALYESNDSILWVGMERGLIRYNRKLETSKIHLLKPNIRRVYFENDSTLYGGTSHPTSVSSREIPQLNYRLNSLNFYFSTPSSPRVEKLQYSFMLDGYESNFSKWQSSNEMRYTNLFEGSYSFRVRSMGHAGKISQEGTFDFKILPPWYRTYWAYGFYLLLFVGLVSFISYLRSRKLVKERNLLEGLVKERTAEVENANSDLKEKNAIIAKKN